MSLQQKMINPNGIYFLMKKLFTLLLICTMCAIANSCEGRKRESEYRIDYEVNVIDEQSVKVDGQLMSFNSYSKYIDSISQIMATENLRIMFFYDDDTTVGAVKKMKRPIRRYNNKFAVVYEDGTMVKLPPWSDDKINYNLLKERNVYDIGILNEDSIWANGRIISQLQTVELAKELKTFIKSEPTRNDLPSLGEGISPSGDKVYYRNRYIVIVESRNDVPARLYDKIMRICYESYKSVQDDLSMEYFNLEYVELNDDQRLTLNKILPKVIGEVETNYFIDKMR